MNGYCVFVTALSSVLCDKYYTVGRLAGLYSMIITRFRSVPHTVSPKYSETNSLHIEIKVINNICNFDSKSCGSIENNSLAGMLNTLLPLTVILQCYNENSHPNTAR